MLVNIEGNIEFRNQIQKTTTKSDKNIFQGIFIYQKILHETLLVIWKI